MHVLVPFAGETPKTRLSSVLDDTERTQFAHAMLTDVLGAILETGMEPTVVATAPVAVDTLLSDTAVDVVVDDRPLTPAINARLESLAPAPVAVVMADLALVTPETLETLFSTAGDVVLAPGRGGGTNALISRHPDFRVDYHGASYRDHTTIAKTIGATLETVDSFRLATDIDEPTDLVEVMLHGAPNARRYLEAAGFSLEERDGRVGLCRDGAVSVE